MTEIANEIAETDAADESADEVADEVQTESHRTVLEHLREAGDAGKKEWEQILAKTSAVLTERRTQLKATVEAAFSSAQVRGAQLLLGVVGQVRKGVVGLEESLREARSETCEDTPLAA